MERVFEISANGTSLGFYVAASEDAAKKAHIAAAGYSSLEDMAQRTGRTEQSLWDELMGDDAAALYAAALSDIRDEIEFNGPEASLNAIQDYYNRASVLAEELRDAGDQFAVNFDGDIERIFKGTGYYVEYRWFKEPMIEFNSAYAVEEDEEEAA